MVKGNNEMDHDELMEEHNMAVSLYVASMAERGNPDIFTRNPDARALFFMGVHDVICAMQEWADVGVSQEQMALMVSTLHDQTCDAGRTGGTH